MPLVRQTLSDLRQVQSLASKNKMPLVRQTLSDLVQVQSFVHNKTGFYRPSKQKQIIRSIKAKLILNKLEPYCTEETDENYVNKVSEWIDKIKSGNVDEYFFK